jgi:hypothetical protein
MAAVLLVVVLILLVLALTIGFMPFLVGSLYIGGWLLVAVIVLVLIGMLIQGTFRSVGGFFSYLSPSFRRESEIEHRRALGYDTREPQAQSYERHTPRPSSAAEAERRRQLGYTDESNEA